MLKNILVIDGQLFQTDAKDRGMGRYSEFLIKSLIKQSHYSKIQIILSKNLHINNICSEDLYNLFPGVEVVRLDLLDTQKIKLELAAARNKKEINSYISEIKSDNTNIDFLVISPFQEPIAVAFPDDANKLLIFYDLIPYLYHLRYKSLMQFDNYLKRFSLIFEADKILTISKSVRDDLIIYLGIPGERIVSIDGAPIKSSSELLELDGFDGDSKFVLMPTSDDPRKNNLRAVLGFEEFRSCQDQDYKLVITSKIHKNERSRLGVFSDNIIFTGNVKEAELDWLYDKCQAVLFVPESEGLGLPILEGVLAGKRVVCSSLNVFKEISDDAFYYCEHENQHSIADALTRALGTDDRDVPTLKYRSILKHYSWDQTAKRLVKAVGGTKEKTTLARKRIAIFTPAPDGMSAVGKVVAESHSVMSEYFDIDYYAEQAPFYSPTRPNYLQYVANYYRADSFSVEKYSQYDAVVYHIGNSDYHIESICNSLYMPGYAILHDTNISEAYRVMCERGIISLDRKNLEATITDASSSNLSSHLCSVANSQLGILTHSEYAAKALNEIIIDDTPIINVDLATQCSSMSPPHNYKNLTIGLAGIIADIKGIEVIESLANNAVFNDCSLRLFGYNYANRETIDRLKNYSNLTVATNLTDFDFLNSMTKLDIFVNYRMKYQGETSLSTLEAMRQGVVVIVRNVGWYSELPDDAVIKVESEDQVPKVLLDLKSNSEKLAKISGRAIQYLKEIHTHRRYAEGLLKLIESGNENKMLISKQLKSGNIKKAPQLLDLYKEVNLSKDETS
ncbi:hypothetical protein CVV43_03490 [Candidatus Saccharibacteria bacterium HGW-Saccharibacteria-1]|jgi:glycosyltransferase involved in cell wall biosynthesis|nr:MAG: hypothetical protein CVV43_03490 [Candidatus Saccharibacteria bacterium HGW-Saccharibacteria-1]